MWATIGIYALSRLPIVNRSIATALLISALAVFALVNRLDGAERDKAVAEEIAVVVQTVVSDYPNSAIIGPWGLIKSFDHYNDRYGVSEASVSYVNNIATPVTWLDLDADLATMIDRDLNDDRDVYLIVRSHRFDSPVLRLAFPDGVKTNQEEIYRSVFDQYTLTFAGDIGSYHEVFKIGG